MKAVFLILRSTTLVSFFLFLDFVKVFFHKLRFNAYIRKKYPYIDPTVNIGKRTNLFGAGNIIIGKHSHIGNNCILETEKGTTIKIGKCVRISHDVAIYTSNPYSNQDFSKSTLKMRKGNVTIHNYCWIGKGVFIREGVEIGEHSIIGANSVVLHDIEPFSLAVGVPAKTVRRLNKKRC